jgi:hypothetical protein
MMRLGTSALAPPLENHELALGGTAPVRRHPSPSCISAGRAGLALAEFCVGPFNVDAAQDQDLLAAWPMHDAKPRGQSTPSSSDSPHYLSFLAASKSGVVGLGAVIVPRGVRIIIYWSSPLSYTFLFSFSSRERSFGGATSRPMAITI